MVALHTLGTDRRSCQHFWHPSPREPDERALNAHRFPDSIEYGYGDETDFHSATTLMKTAMQSSQQLVVYVIVTSMWSAVCQAQQAKERVEPNEKRLAPQPPVVGLGLESADCLRAADHHRPGRDAMA